MKKTILAPILILLFTQIANAQQTRITWGDLSKIELTFNSFVKGAGSDMIKLCLDEKKAGFFSKGKMTPILVRYDNKLQEKNVQEYKADEDGVKLDKVLSIRGKLYLFTNRYDKDSKSTSYMCVPIDIVTLKATGKIINLGSFEAISKNKQSDVEYELSSDSTKLIMFGKAPTAKKENEKYYMGVYDENMNKLWNKTVELPYQSRFISIFDDLVTNDGKVGVIIKHYDQELNRESIKENGERVPTYKTKLLLYEKDAAKPFEYILNIDNKFVHRVQITDDKANTMNLFGLYKERYNGHVNGFFTASINLTTHQIETNKISAFPADLVELVKKDKQGSDKEKDPGFDDYFKFVQTIDRTDGSKDYLLEYKDKIYHEYKTTENTYGGGAALQQTNGTAGFTTTTTTSYWEYKNGDIIDISVKSDGKFVFCRIPKMQDVPYTLKYNSFKALSYNDKLVIYYNDNDDNLDRDLAKKPETMTNPKKCVFMMASIDSKGNLNRTIVFNHKEVKLTVATNECFLLDEQHLGIYAIQPGGGFFSSSKDIIGILELK